MIYKCEHFHLVELLPKIFYNENIAKYKDNLWFLFDLRALITLDRLRKRYGKTYMNDWKWGGNNDSKGFRPPEDPEGAKLSQHRFGRAADPKFESVTADEAREDLKKNPNDPVFEYITAVEDDKIARTWFHFDTRNWNKTSNGILVIKPIE